MTARILGRPERLLACQRLGLVAIIVVANVVVAAAQDDRQYFCPGNLVVSRTSPALFGLR